MVDYFLCIQSFYRQTHIESMENNSYNKESNVQNTMNVRKQNEARLGLNSLHYDLTNPPPGNVEVL